MEGTALLTTLLFLGFANAAVTSQEQDDYIHYPNDLISYKFFKTPMKWLDAKKRCMQDGAKLAMPRNDNEAQILKSIFEKYPASVILNAHDSQFMLLDSHDMFRDGDFLTLGYNIKYFYHNWGEAQSNSGTSENCLTMYRDGNLHDHRCDALLVFVCQKEDIPYLNRLNNRLERTHDPDYKLEPKSGKFFKLHLDVKNWPTAHSTCHAEGGRLAIVESKEQQEFLVNMLKNPNTQSSLSANKNFVFIGFHDLYEKGQYFTVDDRILKDIGYANWKANEPNNYNDSERCGCIYLSGELNDISCSTILQYICERSIIDIE